MLVAIDPTSKHPVLERVRALAFAYPEVSEKISHGRPTFRTSSVFVYFGGGVKGGDQHDLSILVKCESAEEQRACELEPRYFHPAYLGPAGWVGFDLSDADDDVWAEAAELIDCSYRLTAPKRNVARLDAGEGPNLGVQQWN
ncbi:phosphoribosylglycinamide formyltransferase [Rhodococcus sp. 05-2254-6]|nr:MULTISPECIES: MmcQ/YjbR family DNA-binding protein [unclassified Rhodococcus (in: high G+C Gram-positive bacteria)]OZE42062.1 phosphoribosylglycinamide formyltransferase [Rhodococcus sp. 05-2254-4]OZE43367.1 phosphoribosylglycinamide formyltransferase [Rhodococcus sp. 05-2254-3]OZE47096.1 phosphoribosylglycinamide formyltransferase [Rhodococcus sp. 05-2254-6]OZE50647.1 phosphoribosylglycinamide formyltransferase [Rhodococcus sp. 05-2254-2]